MLRVWCCMSAFLRVCFAALLYLQIVLYFNVACVFAAAFVCVLDACGACAGVSAAWSTALLASVV